MLWISPALPAAFRDQYKPPSGLTVVEKPDQASLWLEIPSIEQASSRPDRNKPGILGQSDWIYAIAAPFPTVFDSVSLKAFRQAWAGRPGPEMAGKPLLMTQETRAALERFFGPAGEGGVQVVGEEALLEDAWQEQDARAVIPFEAIQPRWKVLRLDGQSPLDKDFDPTTYGLSIPIWLRGDSQTGAAAISIGSLPANRDPGRLTVLVMTGTTAISRHIGERMETKGLTYPGEAIHDWLAAADLTHISNEVSFYSACPKPGPERADMRFCSNPKYIQLLEYAGADIIELTGNHNLDWGPQPYLDTLAMYQERGWKTYGGGASLREAERPLVVEQNGNRLVFLGCSPSGPAQVWATSTQPGSAPCDLDKMEAQVRDLRAKGYLPIITFQAIETDTYKPAVAQAMPIFRRMAAAGAVIVSGSQSHVPQTMTFVGESFVHYGLGNLFFDQMKPSESRQEFIDRHVFYDGRYLGVELLTALLEDYSRPRPMNPAERRDFLQKIFSLCDWNGTYP